MSQVNRISTAGFRLARLFAAASLLVACVAYGQTRTAIGEGEVNADDVYVRSGPSTNHYTICKLEAGDRVTILGERGEWYEILPPEGAFSLISGEYVDTADNEAGVVNGNNVRVRAGSSLSKNKYTVQTKLSKGAEVTIIGREPDGFLRIAPPAGVTLWISSDYVEPVPDELVKLQRQGDPAGTAENVDTEGAGEKPAPGAESASSGVIRAADAEMEEGSRSPFAGMQATPQREELEQIDADVEDELAKPLLDRRFAQVLERYGTIAEQEEDEVASRYAHVRCEQINRMVELVDSVKKMRDLGEQTEARRREFLTQRMQLPEMSPPEPDGLDAQGELRESALYPPERDPRRYRLIDPNEASARTIGYVEIPADSTIDARSYLGRYVGVRASRTRLQAGGVDAIPIYLASELVLVTPAASTAAEDSRD